MQHSGLPFVQSFSNFSDSTKHLVKSSDRLARYVKIQLAINHPAVLLIHKPIDVRIRILILPYTDEWVS
jgi:hypothetical protein